MKNVRVIKPQILKRWGQQVELLIKGQTPFQK